VANDHYIPQFLTRPWEFGERRLRVFDFCTRSFEDATARRLFAKRDLNSPTLEKWFNERIETPAGAFAERLRSGDLPDLSQDWTTRRALALLILLNSQRIKEARIPDRDPEPLESFLTWPEAKLDQFAEAILGSFKLCLVTVPRELFFTEFGVFGYPMPEEPVLALPLGLGHALLAYDGPLSADQLLRAVDRHTLAAFSLGVGKEVHRVILSPGWREASIRDPESTRHQLFELREGLGEIFNLVGKASVLAELKGWQVA
jgi:hypothetical protein